MLIKTPYTKSSSIKFNRCQRYVGLEANPIKHQSSTIVISFIAVTISFSSHYLVRCIKEKITYTTSSFIKKKTRSRK